MIEPISINQALSAKDERGIVGGTDYVIELMEGVTSSAHLLHHARLVSQCATLRRLIETAARELGVDRAELRRKNFVREFPYQTPVLWQYDSGNYDGLLDDAISSRGFKRLFAAQRLKAYRDSFQDLKGNKRVCETTVGIFNTLLLAERTAENPTSAPSWRHYADALEGCGAQAEAEAARAKAAALLAA